jgi:hypothetical protein
MSRGKRFESARRLSVFGLSKPNTQNRSDSGGRSRRIVAPKGADSSAVCHPMIRRINVSMQKALRLDPPVW